MCTHHMLPLCCFTHIYPKSLLWSLLENSKRLFWRRCKLSGLVNPGMALQPRTRVVEGGYPEKVSSLTLGPKGKPGLVSCHAQKRRFPKLLLWSLLENSKRLFWRRCKLSGLVNPGMALQPRTPRHRFKPSGVVNSLVHSGHFAGHLLQHFTSVI